MDTAAEKEARRSAIESEHNAIRDGIEKDYIADKTALEEAYHADLETARVNKAEAFLADELNPDGSDPQGRPLGSTV